MPTVDRDLRALVDEMRAALVPFAAAIVPDETCLSGWRFGIIPKHADYVRAHTALTVAESALSASGAPGPVAWRSKCRHKDDTSPDYFITDDPATADDWQASGYEVFPLYAHPQASSLGWRLVPEEPTQEMLNAADLDDRICAVIYRQMLSAAPLPALQETEG